MRVYVVVVVHVRAYIFVVLVAWMEKQRANCFCGNRNLYDSVFCLLVVEFILR